MASRINDAMGYLGDSDERYETGIVGGSLLFVAEHVYLFSGRSHLAGIIRDLSRIYGFHGSEALLEAVAWRRSPSAFSRSPSRSVSC